jgi:3-oxoadipate enol-lactonase
MFGLRLVAHKIMPVMFGKSFLNDPHRAKLKRQWSQYLLANRRMEIVRAVIGVIEREPIYDQINRITAPTLVARGDEDVAISLEQAKRIHSRIARSKLAIIPHAGHTPTVEEPAMVPECSTQHAFHQAPIKPQSTRIKPNQGKSTLPAKKSISATCH